MSDETGSSHVSHWERWTDAQGPFYRSCAVLHFDSLTERRDGDENGTETPAIEVTTGIVRLLLRNLPTLVLAVLAVYIPTSLLSTVAAGRMSLPSPGLTFETILLGIAGVGLGSLWLYLLYRIVSASLDGTSVYRSIVFFATAVPLAGGTAYALYVARTGGSPALTVQAGFFLFILVAGHLTYDGLVLRTENLFTRLASDGIVEDGEYDEFHDDLQSTLGDTLSIGPVSMPRSAAFALAVSLVPLALPIVVLPWNLWAKLGFIPYSVLTLLIVALVYDVFLLVYKFMQLLRSDILVYRPFHPDEHGGFRDLGRFASRVNLILVVTGGYVAYRFYTEGIYYYGAEGFASSLGLLTWAISYLGPVVAYLCFVAFWLYHSFWRLHVKMEEGRKKRLEELQQRERTDMESQSRAFSDHTVDAAPWESLQSAPNWPIKRQSLVGILLLDATPLLVTFLL
ncbi:MULTISPECIES: hypothetical protein [Salinibaculum]|uniref:hypothetical protein n=1 Tax=Salinibaculum TaxID=2732368 RepID=UPI0030D3E16F